MSVDLLVHYVVFVSIIANTAVIASNVSNFSF